MLQGLQVASSKASPDARTLYRQRLGAKVQCIGQVGQVWNGLDMDPDGPGIPKHQLGNLEPSTGKGTMLRAFISKQLGMQGVNMSNMSPCWGDLFKTDIGIGELLGAACDSSIYFFCCCKTFSSMQGSAAC